MLEIKKVTLETDYGNCYVIVHTTPDYISINCSSDLIRQSDPMDVAKLIARGMKAAIGE